MKESILLNQSRELQSPMRIAHCLSYWCHFKGLSFRKSIPSDWGLLLEYPNESRVETSIHMLGMKFDLGIVWIDANIKVVDAKLAKRWKSFLFPKAPAKYALEILPERLPEFNIGDQLTFEYMD